MPEFKDISNFSLIEPTGEEEIQVSSTQKVKLKKIAEIGLSSVKKDVQTLKNTQQSKPTYKTVTNNNDSIEGGQIVYYNPSGDEYTEVSFNVDCDNFSVDKNYAILVVHNNVKVNFVPDPSTALFASKEILDDLFDRSGHSIIVYCIQLFTIDGFNNIHTPNPTGINLVVNANQYLNINPL